MARRSASETIRDVKLAPWQANAPTIAPCRALDAPGLQRSLMSRWFFEPGHTAAEFRVRHMMVTEVRGHFKDVHGTLEVDADDPRTASVDVAIDARAIWSGEPDRDAHLRSADFLDVDHHPTITLRANQVEPLGGHDLLLTGDLTIRGVTRPVTLSVRYLGRWETPWGEGGVD